MRRDLCLRFKAIEKQGWEAMHVQDIDELIEMFKAADDHNYTLFTYVNELNQEVAKLEEQVQINDLPIP
jgi:L-rhamnose mutarotase